jgi:HK97 gp10 family phage protein
MRISFTPASLPDLSGLTDEAKKQLLLTMKGGAMLVLNDANRSIAAGGKTGRIYRRRGIEHQASAPGEPPATDTGALIASGRADAEINGDTVNAIVEYRAPYAVHLEYGTRKMAARPFLTPAIERNRARIANLLRAALRTASEQFAQKR